MRLSTEGTTLMSWENTITAMIIKLIEDIMNPQSNHEIIPSCESIGDTTVMHRPTWIMSDQLVIVVS